MPLSASACDAASGWISDTTFGFMTTYFFCRRTGRIWSSTSASASATFFRRSSPRTSETTLLGRRRAPRRRSEARARRHRPAGDAGPSLRNPRRRHAHGHRPAPRPILPRAMMTLSLLLLLAAPAAAAVPRSRLLRSCPAGSQKGEARSYDTETLFDYMDGNSEGYFAYGFTLMKGVTLHERRRRPAGDRRLGARRRRPRVGLLRHEPRPALAGRGDRLGRPGAAPQGHLREGPLLRRDRGEPRQGPPRVAAGVRRGDGAARAGRGARAGGGRVLPARGPRRRTRCASCRRASSACARCRAGFVGQYPDGRAFVAPETDAPRRRRRRSRSCASASPDATRGRRRSATRRFTRPGPVPRRPRAVFRKGARVAGVANVPAGQDALPLAKAPRRPRLP